LPPITAYATSGYRDTVNGLSAVVEVMP